MNTVLNRTFNEKLGAHFVSLNGVKVAAHYGDPMREYCALRDTAGLLDLSFRSRICLTGQDRVRFLHGQVTNDVNSLRPGQGCYAALITAKGRMQSDLNVWRLDDELLLDFEPGLATVVSERLETYVISEDVQVLDVAPLYGLLGIQGPKAAEVIRSAGLSASLPDKPFTFLLPGSAGVPPATKVTSHPGDIYLMNLPRFGSTGFDVYVPIATFDMVAEQLLKAIQAQGGSPCGWNASEIVRVEAGVPRFGIDMDETNLPLEAGLESRAISFNKGCYIGQEVISRIRTYSEVQKSLRPLRLPDELPSLPAKGEKLFHDGKEAGYLTSVVASPRLKANIALGYVRKGMNAPGIALSLGSPYQPKSVTVVELPFST
jgi:folate-binding protein YgfZ